MYAQRLEFSIGDQALGDISDLANGYLAALRMNGQICGREWPLFVEKHHCVAVVSTPEQCSLNERYNNAYITKRLSEAQKAGIAIKSHTLGEDIDGASCCACGQPSGYILFTTFIARESPIRCLDCFGPVPLYRFPLMPSGDFYEVICWQSDYQACDNLQMNCQVLEKSTTRQLSDFHSQLTDRGRSICRTLEDSSGKPFYYYLYRGHGRSLSSERKRVCPSCGGLWYFEDELHSRFHFKCDRCRLLSNVAWNIQT